MKKIGRAKISAYVRILTKVFQILHTVAHSKNGLALEKSTHLNRFSWELNHNETPDSEGQGEAYRDSMDHDGEVGVDENKNSPWERVHFFRVPCAFLKNVHVESEWNVL